MRIEIDVPDEVCDAFDIARKGEGDESARIAFVVRNVGVLGWKALMAKHEEMVTAIIKRFQAEHVNAD